MGQYQGGSVSVQASEITRLIKRLQKADGADRRLDTHVHAVVHSLTDDASGKDIPHYTASEPACFELIPRVLPGWKWHVGYGVKGVFPYATVSNGRGTRFQASAPTVPLALLLVLLQAMAAS
jgi:hypothetical protein